MKPTAGSSPTSRACPKSNSRVRRASGGAYGSIHTAIIRSMPRRYEYGGSSPPEPGSRKQNGLNAINNYKAEQSSRSVRLFRFPS